MDANMERRSAPEPLCYIEARGAARSIRSSDEVHFMSTSHRSKSSPRSFSVCSSVAMKRSSTPCLCAQRVSSEAMLRYEEERSLQVGT